VLLWRAGEDMVDRGEGSRQIQGLPDVRAGEEPRGRPHL